ALGILVYVVLGALLKGIFVLRFHQAAANGNGIQLVSADATIQEFLPPSFAVEEPFLAPLHKRYREWPILTSHQQECAIPVLRVDGNAFLLASLCGEISSTLAVLREFAAEHDIVQVRTDFRQ